MVRWSPQAGFTLAALAIACSVSVAQAQDFRPVPTMTPVDFSNYPSRIESIEGAPSDMRTRLVGFESYGEADCGCDTGCDGCDACNPCDACCGCCRIGGWFLGADLLFIKPHFQDEAAFLMDRSHLDEIVSFDYNYDVSPRFWLGYVNCCGLGVRARYWNYDNIFSNTTVVDDEAEAFAFSDGQQLFRRLDGDPGNTAFAEHNIDLQTLDLEALQVYDLGNVVLLGSAGIRYVRMEQNYQVLFIDDTDPLQRLNHDHDFEGVGPTVGLELWRPFGWYNLSWYGSTRGSILFGETDQQIVENTGLDEFTERRQNVDDTLAIGELGLGLQWTNQTYYNWLWFVRSGWEGQYWSGAGNANTTSGDMALEGFVLSLGMIH